MVALKSQPCGEEGARRAWGGLLTETDRCFKELDMKFYFKLPTEKFKIC